jgi:hypothetical protein
MNGGQMKRAGRRGDANLVFLAGPAAAVNVALSEGERRIR